MKHWRTIIIIALLAICGIGGSSIVNNYYAPPTERQPYQIPRHNDDTLRIAYIGDSWAAMHKEHNCIIAQMVSERIHRPVKVLSHGLHGKTSKEIYESLFDCRDMRTLMEQGCDFCIISVGINDTYKKMSTDYYKTSIDYITRFLLANHIHPVIFEIPDYDITKAYQRQIPLRQLLRKVSMICTGTKIDCKQAFRDTMKELFKERGLQQQITVLDYQIWNNNYLHDIQSYYLEDGMHLNNEGYLLLDSCIVQQIIQQI